MLKVRNQPKLRRVSNCRISLPNIRPIIIYFHSSQCRLIPYLHQRPIFFRANSSIVATLELIRGEVCWRYGISRSCDECRIVVPYEISKVNFRVETKILVSMSKEKKSRPRYISAQKNLLCNRINWVSRIEEQRKNNQE
jgi:hypothetical protein